MTLLRKAIQRASRRRLQRLDKHNRKVICHRCGSDVSYRVEDVSSLQLAFVDNNSNPEELTWHLGHWVACALCELPLEVPLGVIMDDSIELLGCPDCKGDGRPGGVHCDRCQGSGRVHQVVPPEVT